MVFFLDLPRELRELIYTEVILWQKPKPIIGPPQWRSFRFRRVSYTHSSVTGEFGSAYALEDTPTTCANLLCCNRQVKKEMLEIIELIKKKNDGPLEARLDVIAEDESFHYFTWLSVPLVQTTRGVVREGKSRIMPEWLDTWMSTYLAFPHRWLSTGSLAMTSSTTRIEKLWIDIRLAGDRSRKWTRNSSQSDRTSWAICAALGRLLESGPHLAASTATRVTAVTQPRSRPTSFSTPLSITIKELVLNVLPPPNYPSSRFLDVNAMGNEVLEGMVHPQTVARELLTVWTKIWGGVEYKGSLYQGLLEGIGSVVVKVEGKTVGARPLGRELVKGRRVGGRGAGR